MTRFESISTDSRRVRGGELFVAISGKRYDGHRFIQDAFDKGALGVLASESYLGTDPLVSGKNHFWVSVPDTLDALGDLAAFRRGKSKVSVVAITGTNGKTTTKEMAASVLGQAFSVLKTPGNFNNLIGVPLTLFGLTDSHEWAVLELAMNHRGEIRRLGEICKPDVGVITNIGAGHLEGVNDIDGVMMAKGELLEALDKDGTAVLNIDDQRVCRLAERFEGRVVTFGIHNSAEVWATSVCLNPCNSVFDLCWYDESARVRLPMPGAGAIYSALAAATVGYRIGLSIEEVRKGLEAVPTLPGRMEILTLPGGIYVVNDTYNANPSSMALAINTLQSLKGKGRGILVTGDMLELGAHAVKAHKRLGRLIVRAGASRLYATGEFAEVVAEGAVEAGMDPNRTFIGTHAEIVEDLKRCLGPGDWVLVKGSRLMGMEKVVEGLKAAWAIHESPGRDPDLIGTGKIG